MNKVFAWHYTTGQNFLSITESGWLRPATAYVVPPEKPVLWFSLNQQFEPTALKGLADNGVYRGATLEETYTIGGGLVRFGVSPHDLLGGERLRKRAHIDRRVWAGLAAVGIKAGADPALWMGTTTAIEASLTVIEVRESHSGAWVRVQGAHHG